MTVVFTANTTINKMPQHACTCAQGSIRMIGAQCFRTNTDYLYKPIYTSLMPELGTLVKIIYFHTNWTFIGIKIPYNTHGSGNYCTLVGSTTVRRKSVQQRIKLEPIQISLQLVSIGPHADVPAQSCHCQYCHYYHGNSTFIYLRIAW